MLFKVKDTLISTTKEGFERGTCIGGSAVVATLLPSGGFLDVADGEKWLAVVLGRKALNRMARPLRLSNARDIIYFAAFLSADKKGFILL